RLKQAVQRLANALIIIDNGNDGALATHRASLTGWKTELKDCPIRNARQSADASTVRLDDGPTDRQSHTYSTRLGREERVEDAIRRRRIETSASVVQRDLYFVRSVQLRLDPEGSWPVLHHYHCLDAVQDQIQDDLLQLDPIPQDHRHQRGQLHVRHYLVFSQFALREVQNIPDKGIDVDECPLRDGRVHQRVDARDDVARESRVTGHPLSGRARLSEIGVGACQPMLAGIAVRYNCHQWLVDLMGNGCRELAHCGQASKPRKLPSCFLLPLLAVLHTPPAPLSV